MSLSMAQQAKLVTALMHADRFPHPVQQLELIETHISWVILTGPYAYKIKKPIDLGFLDFSTLAKRRYYCEEELRLNKRTATSLYLDVISINGTPEAPQWDGAGEPLEYAVKMVQFPQSAQLDRLLAAGDVDVTQIDAFAQLIAGFHKTAAVASEDDGYGTPEHVMQPMLENFSQIRERIEQPEYLTLLDELQDWTQQQDQRLRPLLHERKQAGFIREGHGDLHLRNLAWIDDEPVAFDCIEFNPNLRWVDVISDIAFLVMDLHDRQQPALAQRFLNAYLEIGGDYQGVSLLRFYLVYRALVRAKVSAIQLCQDNLASDQQQVLEKDFGDYLHLAQQYTSQQARYLLITHGLSGSGKTTLTQPLLEQLGAIRIRSDVERKRLAGMAAMQSGQAEPGSGIYTADFSQRTYQYLYEQAARLIESGYSVIVDATFLDESQRDLFAYLAQEKQIAFHILDFVAPAEVLRQRILQRTGDASDADLAVLEHQLASQQAFNQRELACVITIDTEKETEVSLDKFH